MDFKTVRPILEKGTICRSNSIDYKMNNGTLFNVKTGRAASLTMDLLDATDWIVSPSEIEIEVGDPEDNAMIQLHCECVYIPNELETKVYRIYVEENPSVGLRDNIIIQYAQAYNKERGGKVAFIDYYFKTNIVLGNTIVIIENDDELQKRMSSPALLSANVIITSKKPIEECRVICAKYDVPVIQVIYV